MSRNLSVTEQHLISSWLCLRPRGLEETLKEKIAYRIKLSPAELRKAAEYCSKYRNGMGNFKYDEETIEAIEKYLQEILDGVNPNVLIYNREESVSMISQLMNIIKKK